MEFTARKLAEVLGGTLEGNPDICVNKVSKIEEGVPGAISFLNNPKYFHYAANSNASVIIVNKDFESPSEIKATLIKVDNAGTAFAKLLEIYNKIKYNKIGISKLASIPETAILGENVYIGDFAVIGENVKIGNNAKIYPQCFVGDNCNVGSDTVLFAGVKLYSETMVGNECIIHSGTVIGSDGFRFEFSPAGAVKVPQTGNVVIEDKVEIGANCAIDRATLGSTIIRKGVKFDNLIHIAHNVEIGENSMLAACNVVAGSTKIGKNCQFSGQVGIVGHLEIADGTIITAQSGISKDVKKPGEVMMGSPAFEAGKYRKAYVLFRNLDNLESRIKKLEQK